ncbi:hypothetical protein BC628DRAFT_523464 [Trametes gibbosa]|nr:hypothetical protein BC628DRAFT_523464 [Trametes gibbosa]
MIRGRSEAPPPREVFLVSNDLGWQKVGLGCHVACMRWENGRICAGLSRPREMGTHHLTSGGTSAGIGDGGRGRGGETCGTQRQRLPSHRGRPDVTRVVCGWVDDDTRLPFGRVRPRWSSSLGTIVQVMVHLRQADVNGQVLRGVTHSRTRIARVTRASRSTLHSTAIMNVIRKKRFLSCQRLSDAKTRSRGWTENLLAKPGLLLPAPCSEIFTSGSRDPSAVSHFQDNLRSRPPSEPSPSRPRLGTRPHPRLPRVPIRLDASLVPITTASNASQPDPQSAPSRTPPRLPAGTTRDPIGPFLIRSIPIVPPKAFPHAPPLERTGTVTRPRTRRLPGARAGCPIGRGTQRKRGRQRALRGSRATLALRRRRRIPKRVRSHRVPWTIRAGSGRFLSPGPCPSRSSEGCHSLSLPTEELAHMTDSAAVAPYSPTCPCRPYNHRLQISTYHYGYTSAHARPRSNAHVHLYPGSAGYPALELPPSPRRVPAVARSLTSTTSASSISGYPAPLLGRAAFRSVRTTALRFRSQNPVLAPTFVRAHSRAAAQPQQYRRDAAGTTSYSTSRRPEGRAQPALPPSLSATRAGLDRGAARHFALCARAVV